MAMRGWAGGIRWVDGWIHRMGGWDSLGWWVEFIGWADGIHSLLCWYLKGFTGRVGEIHLGLSVCKSHNL